MKELLIELRGNSVSLQGAGIKPAKAKEVLTEALEALDAANEPKIKHNEIVINRKPRKHDLLRLYNDLLRLSK